MNAAVHREGLAVLSAVHVVLAVIGVLGVLGGTALLVLVAVIERIPSKVRLHGLASSWSETELVWIAAAMGLSAASAVICVAVARGLTRDRSWAWTMGVGHSVSVAAASLGGLVLQATPSMFGATLGLVVPVSVVFLLLGPLRRGRAFSDRPDKSVIDAAAGPRWATVAGVCLVSAALLASGHQLFWFICDDAYIAFRYVSNSQLGHGYVWNAAPFAPVEGYTSFLWVALLDGVWSVTGLDPSLSSNPISLAFGFVSTAIVGVWAWRLPLTGGLARARVGVLAAVLLGTVTNRTWLTWTTSGLETAFFDAMLLGWIGLVACKPTSRTIAGLWVLAALLTLTRPDGLLFLAATGAAWVLWLAHRRRKISPLDVLAALPAAAPIAHLFWRKATYGLWLPNTYYAKHVSMWPESGLAYVTSFLLEYGAWLPLALVIVALLRWRKSVGWLPRSPLALMRLGLVFTPVFHWGYYTLNVGGDHFEYRIYAHLVPLALLGGVWALDRLLTTRRVAGVVLVVMVIIGLPLPWAHWAASSQLTTRQHTRKMVVDLTPSTPLALRGYTLTFDLLQHYMQAGHVGTRHQEHLVFVRMQQATYPTRQEGLKISAHDYPVHPAFSVGVPAWTLPHVAIIDKLGLNDRVVARHPTSHRSRTMGHDRRPPKGYVECFRPNVSVRRGQAKVRQRSLTAEQVVECDARFYKQMMELDP